MILGMKLIHVATRFEGKAVIDYLGLNPVEKHGSAIHYSHHSEDLHLLVTGIGHHHASKALSRWLCKMLPSGAAALKVLNIGIAGHTEVEKNIGSGEWMTSVQREEEGAPTRLSLPHSTAPNPQSHRLISLHQSAQNREALIRTWGNPPFWVDMEAGFAVVVFQRVPNWQPNQYFCFKIISDHLSDDRIDFRELAKHYDPLVISAVESFLKID